MPFRLIFVLLWSVIVTETIAAPVPVSLFAKGDSLCVRGQYREAALEYERICFRQQDGKVKAEALLRKGRCLKASGDYVQALHTFKRTDTLQLSDSLSYYLHYEAALCAYLASNSAEADFQLLQLHSLSDSAWRDSCLLLQTLVDLEQEHWAESKQHLLRYAELHHLAIDTAKLIGDEKAFHLKDPRKARRLSLFFPGLGQAYAGKPLRGVSSFVLVAGSAAFFGISVSQGYYVSGTFTGLGLFSRFYSGGARYAGRLAEAYNERKTTTYKKEVRELLLPAVRQ